MSFDLSCDNATIEVVAWGHWADFLDNAHNESTTTLCLTIFDVAFMKDNDTVTAIGIFEK